MIKFTDFLKAKCIIKFTQTKLRRQLTTAIVECLVVFALWLEEHPDLLICFSSLDFGALIEKKENSLN